MTENTNKNAESQYLSSDLRAGLDETPKRYATMTDVDGWWVWAEGEGTELWDSYDQCAEHVTNLLDGGFVPVSWSEAIALDPTITEQADDDFFEVEDDEESDSYDSIPEGFDLEEQGYEVWHASQYPDALDQDDAEHDAWYWWACQPGCLPDGDPNGPYESYEDAVRACVEDSGFGR